MIDYLSDHCGFIFLVLIVGGSLIQLLAAYLVPLTDKYHKLIKILWLYSVVLPLFSTVLIFGFTNEMVLPNKYLLWCLAVVFYTNLVAGKVYAKRQAQKKP